MKAILERETCSYVKYSDFETANIEYESFWMTKRFLGIPIYRKRHRTDSNVQQEKRDRKSTGFK